MVKVTSWVFCEVFHATHRMQRHDQPGIDEALEVECEGPVADEETRIVALVEALRGDVR